MLPLPNVFARTSLTALMLAATALSCSDAKSPGEFVAESAACEDFSACGGDPEGSWQLDGICVDDPKAQFTPLVNTSTACTGVLLSYEARAAGSATLSGATSSLTGKLTVRHEFGVRITSACASVIVGQSITLSRADCRDTAEGLGSELGYTGASCDFNDGACACVVTGEVELELRSTYQVRGTSLSDTGNGRSYPFCESGGALTVARVEVGGDLTATLSFSRRE